MNLWLLGAGLLSVASLLGHHFAGGAQVLQPSLKELQTEMLRVNMRFQFLMPTLLFAINAVVFFGAALGRFPEAMTVPLSTLYLLLGSALFWCGVTSTEEGALMKVFPWVLFLVSGVAGLVGVYG